MTRSVESLRCISYLAPSLPHELFQVLTDYLAASLEMPASITYETRFSAPTDLDRNPFALHQADLGFVCATAVAMANGAECGYELLGCAPLFGDARAGGKPVYFSDVVVRYDSPLQELEDLEDCVWAYNDNCSLSGYYCLLQFLRGLDRGLDFLGGVRASGSHLQSLEMVLNGDAHAASIDSTVLALQRRARPELDSNLRVIASWGPFPVQPVVVRRDLPARTKTAVRGALSRIAETVEMQRRLEPFMLLGFGPVDEAFYEQERLAIQGCTPDASPRFL